MVTQADAQRSLPPCALRGPQRPPCGGIERRVMRDWDAWSDGLEVVGASRDGGRAGRVASCHCRHGRQLSVERGGTRRVDPCQQETYQSFPLRFRRRRASDPGAMPERGERIVPSHCVEGTQWRASQRVALAIPRGSPAGCCMGAAPDWQPGDGHPRASFDSSPMHAK